MGLFKGLLTLFISVFAFADWLNQREIKMSLKMFFFPIKSEISVVSTEICLDLNLSVLPGRLA